jgi:hypothetical protein
VIESGDRSAAYHLAKQHEARGNVRGAGVVVAVSLVVMCFPLVFSTLVLTSVRVCAPRAVLAAQLKDALFYFEKAGRYNHAVRIAKEAGMDNDLAALALQASKKVQLDAARYVLCTCVCA